jgi:mono/diheme cytochrome c family protein
MAKPTELMAKPTELIEIVEGVANDKAPATSAVQGQKVAPASSSSSSASPLNAQERRGRAIYLRGESVSGREIKALLGDLDVPSSTVTCAGCHGARGEGKTEGGAPSTSLVSAVRNSIASVVTYVIAAGNDGADYGNFSPHSPFKSLSIKPHPLQSIRPCLFNRWSVKKGAGLCGGSPFSFGRSETYHECRCEAALTMFAGSNG